MAGLRKMILRRGGVEMISSYPIRLAFTWYAYTETLYSSYITPLLTSPQDRTGRVLGIRFATPIPDPRDPGAASTKFRIISHHGKDTYHPTTPVTSPLGYLSGPEVSRRSSTAVFRARSKPLGRGQQSQRSAQHRRIDGSQHEASRNP